MTCRQMIMLALGLLNYTSPSGATDQGHVEDIITRGLELVNQVYMDLAQAEGKSFDGEDAISRMTNLSDVIRLSDRVQNDVMPYGVAAMIALQEGDGLNQSYYSSVYSDKRRGVHTRMEMTDKWKYGV